MSITVMTAREFNQDSSRAKKRAALGPVFLTDRGTPTHVLLSIDAYYKNIGKGKNLAEILAMPDDNDFDFDPPKLSGPFYRLPELG
jgi:hypothetical protein